MEGVIDAPFVAPTSHRQTLADADACEPTLWDWWFQDGDLLFDLFLAVPSVAFETITRRCGYRASMC